MGDRFIRCSQANLRIEAGIEFPKTFLVVPPSMVEKSQIYVSYLSG